MSEGHRGPRDSLSMGWRGLTPPVLIQGEKRHEEEGEQTVRHPYIITTANVSLCIVFKFRSLSQGPIKTFFSAYAVLFYPFGKNVTIIHRSNN